MERGERELVFERARVVADHFGPVVRPLVTDVNNRFELKGSGVLVRFGSEIFLFTAAHVLDEPFLWSGTPEGFVPLPAKAIMSSSRNGRRQDDRADVGIVPIPQDLHQTLATGSVLTSSDLDIDDLSIDAPATKHYLVVGYPASKAKFNFRERCVRFEALVLTSKSAGARAYKKIGVTDSTHLVLDFEKKTSTAPDGHSIAPDLFGASGGGIWNLGNEYHAAGDGARLVGIGIEWHRREKAIVGTRIAVFCDVLRQWRPDLAEDIPGSRRHL
jgi:hypothetical protein